MNTAHAHSIGTDSPAKQREFSRGFKAYELISVEVSGFLGVMMGFILLVAILTLVFVPFVMVASAGKIDLAGQLVEVPLALICSLFAYGIFVARYDNSKRKKRLIVQWTMWSAIAFGLALLWFCSYQSCAVATTAMAVTLTVGAWIGNRFPQTESKHWLGLATDEELLELGKAGKLPELRRCQIKKIAIPTLLALLIAPAFFVAVSAIAKVSDPIAIQAEQIRYVGKPAPAATFTTTDNQPWALADQRGKIVLLDATARFNCPSDERLSFLSDLHKRFGNRDDFAMATICCDKGDPKLLQWMKQQNVSWQLLVPVKHSFVSTKALSSPLQLRIVDKAGTVTLVSNDLSEIKREVERLLAATSKTQ